MTFLEKSAWIMTVALTVSGLLYFNAVIVSSQVLGYIAPPNIGLIAFATIVIVAFAIFGHVFAALGSPTDANAPADERDKRVAQRAGNIAGWIQNISVFVGISHFAWLGDGNLLFHTLVLGLVLSQITEYVLAIWFYRRGV